jgi:hypothetical protein
MRVKVVGKHLYANLEYVSMLSDFAADVFFHAPFFPFNADLDFGSITQVDKFHHEWIFFRLPRKHAKEAKEMKINVSKFKKIFSLIVKNESFYAASFSFPPLFLSFDYVT